MDVRMLESTYLILDIAVHTVNVDMWLILWCGFSVSANNVLLLYVACLNYNWISATFWHRIFNTDSISTAFHIFRVLSLSLMCHCCDSSSFQLNALVWRFTGPRGVGAHRQTVLLLMVTPLLFVCLCVNAFTFAWTPNCHFPLICSVY